MSSTQSLVLPSSPPCRVLVSGRPPGYQVVETHSGPEGPASCTLGWSCSLLGCDPLSTLTWLASYIPSTPASQDITGFSDTPTNTASGIYAFNISFK